ncbi:hypothetical protein WJX84_004542 [Apatococcus fuscideae]|uniref:Uncharacterized protein n=1 Tax=Apatococcus fuscideae TaxID=2026836 RepID=A0AAW1SSQ5_9CHLO
MGLAPAGSVRNKSFHLQPRSVEQTCLDFYCGPKANGLNSLQRGVLQTPTPHDLQLSLGRAVPRSVEWVVIDSLKGGSGQAFDWQALDVPADLSTNGWLLAGAFPG